MCPSLYFAFSVSFERQEIGMSQKEIVTHKIFLSLLLKNKFLKFQLSVFFAQSFDGSLVCLFVLRRSCQCNNFLFTELTVTFDCARVLTCGERPAVCDMTRRFKFDVRSGNARTIGRLVVACYRLQPPPKQKPPPLLHSTLR